MDIRQRVVIDAGHGGEYDPGAVSKEDRKRTTICGWRWLLVIYWKTTEWK